MEPGILRVLEGESTEELLGVVPQLEELLAHRLQPISQRLHPVDGGTVQGEPGAVRRPFVAHDEGEFR